MDLYVFSSETQVNVDIGYRNRLWAVSLVGDEMMQGRRTRAKRISKGDAGVLYVKRNDVPVFTVPFHFVTTPDLYGIAPNIWPDAEPWQMPFRIDPLGSPEHWWPARHALYALPFNGGGRNTNLSSVFKVAGTVVFSPVDIGEDDWQMLLDRLAKH